ncbi:ribosome maturation factor RimP [bacterium]
MVQTMILESSQLEIVITPAVEKYNCDLIEIKIKGSSSRPLIQVFIDRTGGVTIDDCTKITRQLTEVLDIEFPDIPQYRLEVSSPGLNRPLKSDNDFRRNIGRQVDIQYCIDEQEQSVEGEIVKIDNNKVQIRSGNEIVEIPLDIIRLAQIKLKW